MPEQDLDGLEYICGVFKELPEEGKEYVLHVSQCLLEIQENHIPSESKNTISPRAKDGEIDEKSK